MTRKAYSEYKSSGCGWLGRVPVGWQVKRLRFCTRINPSKSETRGLDSRTAVSFVSMEAVGECGGLRLDQAKPLDEVTTGYTYFRDGDVLIAKITPCFENWKGAIAEGLENGVGFGTTELHVLRPGPDLDRKYLFYLTLGHAFRNIGRFYMYGAGGQKRVPEDFVRDFLHPIPSIDEQRAIAAFLDRETARIDALIEKKERQIELLHEKRAAVISHAVTKGLDPKVRMKDSGIEWLGEIPEHWDTIECKFAFSIQLGKMLQNEPQTVNDEQVPYLKALHVRWESVDTSDLPEMWASLGDIRRYSVRDGDLLVCEGGEVGRAGILRNSPAKCIMQNALHRVRPRGGNSNLFLMYLLEVASYRGWFDILCNRATIAHFTGEKFALLCIPLPPTNEQRAIAAFLDRETARIDALIEKIKKSIDLLREYRTALITAAVTGKIDVREEVP